MVDDLSSNEEFLRLKDRVRRLESSLMLQDAAISEGGIEVVGPEPIYIGLDEDGHAIILVGTGLTIDPSASGGAIKFANGSILASNFDDGWVQLKSGSGWEVNLSNAFILGKSGPNASQIVGGENALSLQSKRIELVSYADGVFMFPQEASSSGMKLLAVDDDGKIWKVTGGGGSGEIRFPFARSTHTTYPGHSGADWARPAGTEIHAIGPGTVVGRYAYSGNTYDWDSSEPVWRGNCLVINHGTIGDHEIWSLYAHMLNAPSLQVGDTVTGGQIIGAVGNTGFSDGNHLHFEVVFDGVRLNTGQGGYERTIGWMDANTDGSSWA